MVNKHKYIVSLLMQDGINLSIDYYSFSNGDENDFVAILKEMIEYNNTVYDKFLSESGRGAKTKERIGKIIRNSPTLDWRKIWDIVDLQDLRGYNIDVFDKMLKSIYYDEFIEKVKKCNRYVLVCFYFIRYATINDLPIDELMRDYNDYLDIYSQRTKNDLRQVLLDTVDHESFVKNQRSYSNCQLAYNSSFVAAVSALMDKTQSTFDKTRVLEQIMLNKECQKPLIRKFLSLTSDLYFEKPGFKTDRVDLNILIRNGLDAVDSFYNKRYTLYDDNQVNDFIKNGTYRIKNNDLPFTDRLSRIIRHYREQTAGNNYGGFNKNDFISIIGGDKVRIIHYDDLKIIRDILDKDEFSEFMIHVIEDDVKVYFGDTTLITYEYTTTKAPKLSASEWAMQHPVQSMLEKGQYIKK